MNVSTLVFLGLAVVWAIVLLPELLRKLSGVRSSDSIRSFNQQLAVLDRSGGRRADGPALAPVSTASNVIDFGSRGRARGLTAAPAPQRQVSYSVRRRRQEVLSALGAAAVLTLVCTVAFGGVFLALHLLADLLLVAYVVELYRVSQGAPAGRAVERRTLHSRTPLLAAHVQTSAVGRAMPATRRIAN